MSEIKAVIDTSGMVSVAFAHRGIAKQLRELVTCGRIVVVTSKPILKELFQVLHYPHIIKRYSPSEADINAFIALVIECAIVVEGLYEIDGVSEDPDDDMFIACALEGNAQYIVSRDPHLRNIKHYRGIQIIDASAFVKIVKRQLG